MISFSLVQISNVYSPQIFNIDLFLFEQIKPLIEIVYMIDVSLITWGNDIDKSGFGVSYIFYEIKPVFGLNILWNKYANKPLTLNKTGKGDFTRSHLYNGQYDDLTICEVQYSPSKNY